MKSLPANSELQKRCQCTALRAAMPPSTRPQAAQAALTEERGRKKRRAAASSQVCLTLPCRMALY